MIDTVPFEPDPDFIRWLESLLDAAREGHITGLAAAWVGPGQHYSHGWHTGPCAQASRLLLSEVTMLQQDIVVQRGLYENDSALADSIGEYL